MRPAVPATGLALSKPAWMLGVEPALTTCAELATLPKPTSLAVRVTVPVLSYNGLDIASGGFIGTIGGNPNYKYGEYIGDFSNIIKELNHLLEYSSELKQHHLNTYHRWFTTLANKYFVDKVPFPDTCDEKTLYCFIGDFLIKALFRKALTQTLSCFNTQITLD